MEAMKPYGGIRLFGKRRHLLHFNTSIAGSPCLPSNTSSITKIELAIHEALSMIRNQAENLSTLKFSTDELKAAWERHQDVLTSSLKENKQCFEAAKQDLSQLSEKYASALSDVDSAHREIECLRGQLEQAVRDKIRFSDDLQTARAFIVRICIAKRGEFANSQIDRTQRKTYRRK